MRCSLEQSGVVAVMMVVIIISTSGCLKETDEDTITVHPDETYDLFMEFDDGDEVTWSWDAGMQLSFAVKEVVSNTIVDSVFFGQDGSGSFTADGDVEYVFRWTHSYEVDVEVRYKIEYG